MCHFDTHSRRLLSVGSHSMRVIAKYAICVGFEGRLTITFLVGVLRTPGNSSAISDDKTVPDEPSQFELSSCVRHFAKSSDLRVANKPAEATSQAQMRQTRVRVARGAYVHRSLGPEGGLEPWKSPPRGFCGPETTSMDHQVCWPEEKSVCLAADQTADQRSHLRDR